MDAEGSETRPGRLNCIDPPKEVRQAGGGHGVLEIGQGQAEAMEHLFPGLDLVRIAPDLAGIPRAVILRKP